MAKNASFSFSKDLQELKNKGLYIDIKTIEGPIDAVIKVNGKKVLNFCSNNYLGLANDKRLIKAVKNAMDKYGVGPAGVRTIAGNTKLHVELEQKLAKFKKVEDVIVLQSGFTANLATIPAIVGKDDIIFSDELNHASIIDACRLSKAKVIRFNHMDPEDLQNKILSLKVKGQSSNVKCLVVTDGVFSMDGDIAPLPQLAKVAKKNNCLLMVDDAHGEGVLGKNGRGIVDHFDLHGKVDIEIGTLSKAFGVVGGYVAGKKGIVEWLRQRGRPFLFSSALTIPDTAAAIEAVNILQSSGKPVKKLLKNTNYFKKGLSYLGFKSGNTQTPIIPIMIGEADIAQRFSKELFKNGVFAMAITYPTVPKDTARIRVMISAAHSKAHLDKGLEVMERVGKNFKLLK